MREGLVGRFLHYQRNGGGKRGQINIPMIDDCNVLNIDANITTHTHTKFITILH